LSAAAIGKAIGRPSNGVTYKLRNLQAFVKKQNCTTDDAVFQAIFTKHNVPFVSVEDVLTRVKSTQATT